LTAIKFFCAAFLMAALALAPLVVLVWAYNATPPQVLGGERIVTQPAPQASRDTSPICMPCFGPHLSLTGGGLSMGFSAVGIGF
jgi:hypothetical protein